MKKRFECAEDALKVLRDTKVSVDNSKTITFHSDLTLSTSGAVDYLVKHHGFVKKNEGRPSNWNIKGL